MKTLNSHLLSLSLALLCSKCAFEPNQAENRGEDDLKQSKYHLLSRLVERLTRGGGSYGHDAAGKETGKESSTKQTK